MDLRGDQLFRQRLAGIDVIRTYDAKSELHRRGFARGHDHVTGRNKIDEGTALRSGVVLCRAEQGTQQHETGNRRDKAVRLHFSPVAGAELVRACSKACLIASSMTDLLISPTT